MTVAGAPAAKASRLVAPDEPVHVARPAHPFVSRGGLKLAAALERFGIEVEGRHAIDAGASTGGFTDCLLQRGAAHVVAIDVGRGQLHARLQADARVEVRERTNVRTVTPGEVGGPVPLVVADLSFISLRTVARALLDLVTPGGDLVALVKPQFEAGRREASRGKGVIRDPAVWRDVLEALDATWREAGAAMIGLMVSPITGAEGNVEFLAHVRAPGGTGAPALRSKAMIEAVLADASTRSLG